MHNASARRYLKNRDWDSFKELLLGVGLPQMDNYEKDRLRTLVDDIIFETIKSNPSGRHITFDNAKHIA